MHPPHGHMARALATVLDDGAVAKVDAVVRDGGILHEEMVAFGHGVQSCPDGGCRWAIAPGMYDLLRVYVRQLGCKHLAHTLNDGPDDLGRGGSRRRVHALLVVDLAGRGGDSFQGVVAQLRER